jgi:hypothetical protein
MRIYTWFLHQKKTTLYPEPSQAKIFKSSSTFIYVYCLNFQQRTNYARNTHYIINVNTLYNYAPENELK